jgi:urease accessory protein
MPAHAHHAMEGQVPQTVADGLLSGLAHPVIGPDHFVTLVALGLVASLSSRFIAVLCIFLVALLAGVGLHVAEIALPWVEPAIAACILLLGWALFRPAKPLFVNLLFALAGVLHGYAHGESIVGAEVSPLGAYLAGLVAIQGVVALSVCCAARGLTRLRPVGTTAALRAGGIACITLGATLTLIVLSGV